MKLTKKPGKVFFGLMYVLGGLLLFYLILWNWKPDFIELWRTDFNALLYVRLALLATILIIPSILISRGKKFIPIKFAATFSGLWMLMFVIVVSISTATAQGMAEWLNRITKPLLFMTIIFVFFWSCVEILKAQETKR